MLDLIIFVNFELLFLLLSNVSYVLNFLLVLINHHIFFFYFVFQLLYSAYQYCYLSVDSIDISFAFKLVRMALYMSICLYAFSSYFFTLSIYFVFFCDVFTESDLFGLNFCLFIRFVNSSFWCFNFSISYLFICVSRFIFFSLCKGMDYWAISSLELTSSSSSSENLALGRLFFFWLGFTFTSIILININKINYIRFLIFN